MAVPATGPTTPVVTRYAGNPILTRDDIPYPATLVYNPGVVRYQGRYVMVVRIDDGGGSEALSRHEGAFHLGLAFSDDGVHWQVEPEPILEWIKSPENLWAYDPRLTVLEGRCYMTFALDTRHGLRSGIAVTDDFRRFELLHLSLPELRNVVLFPRRINGLYLRLERPFPMYLRRILGRDGDRFDIWLSESPDMRYWGNSDLLLPADRVPYANEKVGAGPPPIETDRGWLVMFHAVDSVPTRPTRSRDPGWTKRYTAGVMLLDRDDPRRVVGISSEPVLAPEAPYEVEGGYRNAVVFPTGAVLEDDGTLRFYYGAADTTVCLASARLDDLVALCRPLRA